MNPLTPGAHEAARRPALLARPGLTWAIRIGFGLFMLVRTLVTLDAEFVGRFGGGVGGHAMLVIAMIEVPALILFMLPATLWIGELLLLAVLVAAALYHAMAGLPAAGLVVSALVVVLLMQIEGIRNAGPGLPPKR